MSEVVTVAQSSYELESSRPLLFKCTLLNSISKVSLWVFLCAFTQ